MNNEWVVFTENGFEARRRKPRVTLTKEKRFRFNKKAVELMGEPTAVEFRFDMAQRRIGLRAIDPEADNSFPIRKEPAGRSLAICGAMFCNRFGINPESTVEFRDIRLDDEGTLILDLKTARRLR